MPEPILLPKEPLATVPVSQVAPPPKIFFKSKTVLVNAVVIILPMLWPAGAAWVSANPQLALAAFGIINVALRAITKGSISLFGDDAAN